MAKALIQRIIDCEQDLQAKEQESKLLIMKFKRIAVPLGEKAQAIVNQSKLPSRESQMNTILRTGSEKNALPITRTSSVQRQKGWKLALSPI